MSDTSALVSLAILKVDSDVEGRDYVDYLVPFVSYVLDRFKPDPVSSQNVQHLLREEFKLRIPVHATEMVLRRFAKRKYLVREHGIYTPVRSLPATQIDILRGDARDRTIAVVEALRDFVRADYALDWTDAQAVDAITAYLSRFSVECLRCYAHGTALPELKQTPQDQQLFLVNRFAIRARSSAPDVFEHLIVLVKGQMLSNALTCSDLGSIPRKFGGVTFYLDTPIILALFGLEGSPLEQAAVELLELVKNLKGTFAVFEHTAEEVYRVLEGAERHLDDPHSKGLVIAEMRRAGKTASDLALVRGRLQDLYKKHDVSKRNTPPYTPQFQIDEAVLHDALEDEITYSNVRAVDYDVNSIRSIYALRRGASPSRLEDAGAVLVTSNSALARAAYEYGRSQESTREVSAVITNFSLANLAWLKAPLGSPDLPQAEVIALCYAAMNPRESLWSAYIKEIEKLERVGDITPRDHELLRYSLRARDELMNLTLGSEDAFSQRTVTQILETVKSELTREKDAEIANEKAMRLELAAKAVREAESLAQEQEAFRRSAKAELDAALHAQESVRKRMYWLSDRMSAYLSYVTSCLLIVVLLSGLLLSGIYAKPLTSGNLLISLAAAAVVWLAVIWGVISWVLGLSVKDLHSHIRTRLRSTVYRLLCAVFSVSPDSGVSVAPALRPN